MSNCLKMDFIGKTMECTDCGSCGKLPDKPQAPTMPDSATVIPDEVAQMCAETLFESDLCMVKDDWKRQGKELGGHYEWGNAPEHLRREYATTAQAVLLASGYPAENARLREQVETLEGLLARAYRWMSPGMNVNDPSWIEYQDDDRAIRQALEGGDVK